MHLDSWQKKGLCIILVRIYTKVFFSYLGNNGDVQLMNGSTATEGRVEVCVSGAWSGVCSDGDWNFQDAFVTCRQLGYPATGIQHIPFTIFLLSYRYK